MRVIPGVTSAIAAPSLAGIPVTHRTLSQGFAVVSGHVAPDDPRSTVAVSYTHLDVYKRQPFAVHGARAVITESRANPESRLLLAAAGATTFVLSAIKLPSITGSSSHPTGTGAGACLLYTSRCV